MNNTDKSSGLQRILKKIEADGLEAIKKFDKETDDELKKRSGEIIADANARAAVIIRAAEKKAAQIAENTESGAEARVKRAVLSAQAEVLDECIKFGTDKIKSMPDKEYFELIEKLIIKYADDGISVLLLSAKDIGRLPSDFEDRVNERLADKGAGIKISDEHIRTDGGFVLRRGGTIDGIKSTSEYCIEENCTFDAMINDNIEAIRDKLYKKLKAQGVLQ